MPKVKYELGKHYTVSIMLFLLEEEEVNTSDFRKISGHYKGPVRRCEELESYGLVDIEYQTKPIHKATYSLTEDGEDIAKELLEIEEKIKEYFEGSD